MTNPISTHTRAFYVACGAPPCTVFKAPRLGRELLHCGKFAMFCGFLVITLWSIDSGRTGELVPREQSAAAGQTRLRYWLYLPEAYETQDKWPLMLFLHGGGEGGGELEKVKKHGPPKLLDQGASMPMIVVAPQNPSETQFWDDQALSRLLDELDTQLKVDSRRIYLTGLSRGGYGAWRLAIQNPDRFAALVPISGGGAQPYVKRIKDLPTWVFHGAKDPVIPVSESERMVRALKAAGGDVRLTVYPDAAHDAWTEAYNTPELYQWLAGQARKN